MVAAVPPALMGLLVSVAEELERGNGVSVLPRHRQLTTTEAAQLLNVSRPHVSPWWSEATCRLRRWARTGGSAWST